MARIQHEYTRRKVEGGGYDICNPLRLHIAKEIESTFPGKKFMVICNENQLFILVDEEDDFSTSEKLTLDQIVYEHRNNL